MEIYLHSIGCVAEEGKNAKASYYPGYAKMLNVIDEESGWLPTTREAFDFQASYSGALIVGDPTQAADKMIRHAEALGGIDRFAFNIDNSLLSHEQFLNCIQLIGDEVIPKVNQLQAS